MIEKIFIISFIVMLIWHAYGEDEIFEWLANWFASWVPEKLHKPVFACSVCMAPWYGTIIYLILWGPDWLLIPTVLASAGLNAIIVRLWPDK